MPRALSSAARAKSPETGGSAVRFGPLSTGCWVFPRETVDECVTRSSSTGDSFGVTRSDGLSDTPHLAVVHVVAGAGERFGHVGCDRGGDDRLLCLRGDQG